MTRAAHLVRPGAKRRKAAEPATGPARERGHYTALMRKPSAASPEGWPPRFESRLPATSAPDWSAISTENRERRVAMGDTGTVEGLSSKPARVGHIDLDKLLPARGRV
jgi:hypothetical protein